MKTNSPATVRAERKRDTALVRLRPDRDFESFDRHANNTTGRVPERSVAFEIRPRRAAPGRAGVSLPSFCIFRSETQGRVHVSQGEDEQQPGTERGASRVRAPGRLSEVLRVP